MEEDETPCVFENHMQVELMKQTLWKCRGLLHKIVILLQSFEAALVTLHRQPSDDSALPNQQEIVFHLSSFTWILQEAKKSVVNNVLVTFCWVLYKYVLRLRCALQ
jgi:hypothetical protein